MAVETRVQREDPPALLERQLSSIWQGQRFPPEALRLPDGRLLQVVYRGRPGGGPGPDFRAATIALPAGDLLHGDIELHVRASDFRRHRHQLDPAYNNVILHVVFYHDGGATLLHSGLEVITIALASWVATRKQQIEDWLTRPPLWREPCHDAVERLGTEEVGLRLQRLGARRLRQKAAALGRRALDEGLDNTVYRELLEAVGYGPNRSAFRRLAAATSWTDVYPDPARRLAEARAALGIRFEVQTRPGAGPEGRLRGASLLIERFARAAGPQLGAAVLALTLERPADLLASLAVKEDERTLIGQGRAAEIVVNVVLPAALLQGAAEEQILALYETIPDPGNYGVTSYLQGILSRRDPALVRGAARRQGLLLLQQEYCGEGHCGACPLSTFPSAAGGG